MANKTLFSAFRQISGLTAVSRMLGFIGEVVYDARLRSVGCESMPLNAFLFNGEEGCDDFMRFRAVVLSASG